MRWVILTLTVICGLMLVNQASLSHRIHTLETERDKLQTDLQSQNQRLDQTQSILQDTQAKTAADSETASAIHRNVPHPESQSQNPFQTPSAQPPSAPDPARRATLTSQSMTSQNSRPAVPEYNPFNPASPPTEEPVAPTELVATNSTARAWGPEQLLGPPDTDRSGDLPTAWASLQADGSGTEWVWAGFDQPVSLAEVRIRESFNPGAISKVTARVGDQEIVLWEGIAAGGRAPRDFVVPVDQNIQAQNVIVYLDSDRIAGWNEIDAIELVGRDGSRQWASSANASSTYAERTPVSLQSLSSQ
jgi:hypothetical protein